MSKYMEHYCYCSRCRQAHRAVVPVNYVQAAIDRRSGVAVPSGGYRSDLDPGVVFSLRYLPGQECSACLRRRIGSAGMEAVKEWEARMLRESATTPSS